MILRHRYLRYLPFYLFSLLPMPVLYFLADLVGAVLYYIVRYRNEVVYSNIRESFPEKDEKEIRRIVKKFYIHFCDVWVENNKALTIGRENIKKRFFIKNPELITRCTEQQKSVIFYSGHVGNWEWMLAFPLYFPVRINAFYKPLSNAYFDEYVNLTRTRFGVHTIISEQGYRLLSELVHRGTCSANIVIGDQRPLPAKDLYFTPFLNRQTAFLEGAERMAYRLGHAVLFPRVTLISRGHYEIEFIPIDYDRQEKRRGAITGRYAQLLEESIRRTPHMWLWSHNRWKDV
jgi:KDO2-lipid IV(A) lauroyltransferase